MGGVKTSRNFYLFIHGFIEFVSYGFQNSSQCCIQYLKPIESSSYAINPVESSKNLVIQNIMSSITPIVQVFYQLPSLTILNTNIVFNSSYLTFLVPMYDNFISPSHHTILYRLDFSPFSTKCNPLAILWSV